MASSKLVELATVEDLIQCFSQLRCIGKDFQSTRYDDNGYPTSTSLDQAETEKEFENCVLVLRDAFESQPTDFQTIASLVQHSCNSLILNRADHLRFLHRGLQHLPASTSALDSSQPWILFWILHSIDLLNCPLPNEQKLHIAEFLRKCQHPDGGFGGGPGQDSHLAPTYAAVSALCTLRCREAYDVIDRQNLLQFLLRIKQPDGSFRMSYDSEVDVRGVYCALSVAMITNVWCKGLITDSAHWISRCQTYEGGFGGVPGAEAHGGYTYCSLASLILLREANLININKLLSWLTKKQLSFEGGFQGRTNKLSDSCYSFWQGACFPLIHRILNRTAHDELSNQSWLFDQQALQEFILVSCQYMNGGLIDKATRERDYYHTCYALSGLSTAQHFYDGVLEKDHTVGPRGNTLEKTHPIYNICVESAMEAINYFQKHCDNETDEESPMNVP